MSELVFLLEERSAKEMLIGLLPRLLPSDVSVRYVVFDGKQDLERQIVRRMRGYLVPDARFVVLRDQDAADCEAVKAELLDKCREAGRADRCFVRIACHELESWYLADLKAVSHGLGIPSLASRQQAWKFRLPDALQNPATELFRLTGGRYHKISGSRSIGTWIDPENSRSRSFTVFVDAVRRSVTGV